MIPMTCLAELEVPIPDMQTQRAIAAIDRLAQQEFMLTSQLAERRRQLLAASLLKAANESIHNHTRTKAAIEARPAKGGKS